MHYRTLGTTGLNVSVVGIGTWQLGGEWGKDFTQCEVDAIVRAAHACGVNFIDTAECYGDHVSEALIGNAIAGSRGDWIVATKFGHRFHRHLDRTRHFGAEDVKGQIEASLRALRTDYIDLLQSHSPTDEEFFNDELWTMLDKQVQAGAVRHLGLSLSPPTNVRQVDGASARRIRTVQVVYNRLERGAEEAVLPSCVRQGLGVLARVPLASGLLSGKYAQGAVFAASDQRSGFGRERIDAAIREAERIRREEVPADLDMAQWALAWCLRHPAVTCVIPGCKSAAQVQANAAAAAWVSGDHPLAAKA